MKLTNIEEVDWPGQLAASNTRLTVRLMNFPFRFLAPEGWDTGDVVLAEHLIYCVGQGRCRIVLAGQEKEMISGEICWANPGTRIRLFRPPGESQPELYRFRFSLVAGGRLLRLPWDHQVCRASPETLEWARQWVQESEHPRVAAQHRMKSFAVLFSLAFFEGCREGEQRQQHGLSRKTCADLMDWVTRHPAQRFKPSDLAKRSGLSPGYFSRLFRHSFQMSPKAWILKQRLRYAAGMLAESDWTISAIAAELSYDDLYLFSRQFKKEFGLSPREWRKSRLQYIS